MARRVALTHRAEHELYSAAAWWAERHSALQARKWLVAMFRAIDSLSDGAESCPPAPESNVTPLSTRELYAGVGRHPTHRIVFTFDSRMVLVVAVRHLAQDRLTAEEMESP